MVIKSFFADSVANAIQAARKQFGDEALLLKTRRTPEEWRHHGAYEVVFGLAAEGQGELDAPAEESSVEQTPERAAFEPQVAKGALLDAGFSAQVAAQLISAAQTGARETPSRAVGDVLADEAVRLFRADSTFGPQREPWQIAVVGPPGSGKTLTAVRLAVIRGIACNRSVRVLSACDDRIGGAERMRCYAALLKVKHETVKDASELKTRLSEDRDASTLTIIDTPGVSARDMGRYGVMARALSEAPSVQKHLVLPATMNAEDLKKAAEGFVSFGFDRLIFSRLDETWSLGAMLSVIASTGKPASFYTTGQEAPGDISPAESLNVRRVLKSCQEAAGELAA